MSEAPSGDDRKSENAPDIIHRDKGRRLATWLNESDFGLKPSSLYEKRYLDRNGDWQVTNKIGQGDYLTLARMLEKTHDEVLVLQQEYNRDHGQQQRDSAYDRDDGTQDMRNQEWQDENRSREDIRREEHDRKLSEGRTRKPARNRDRSAR